MAAGAPLIRRPLAAAYMLSGDGVDDEKLHHELASLPIGGFEVPLHEDGSPLPFPLRRPEELATEWTCMISCVPVLMRRLLPERIYGLASADEEARLVAVADVLRGIEAARNAASAAGRAVVSAIEIHTSPGPTRGCRDAMSRSLDRLLDDDDAPLLVVEHCDAEVPGRDAVKGFWSLDDEIALVDQYREPGNGPGRVALGLNWGRSAIEGRGPERAITHIEDARSSGLLHSLIFSGATGDKTLWGEPWSDMHIPPRGSDLRLRQSAASLLGADEISQAVGAAGPDTILGFKVGVRPMSAGINERIGVAAATASMINQAVATRLEI